MVMKANAVDRDTAGVAPASLSPNAAYNPWLNPDRFQAGEGNPFVQNYLIPALLAYGIGGAAGLWGPTGAEAGGATSTAGAELASTANGANASGIARVLAGGGPDVGGYIGAGAATGGPTGAAVLGGGAGAVGSGAGVVGGGTAAAGGTAVGTTAAAGGGFWSGLGDFFGSRGFSNALGAGSLALGYLGAKQSRQDYNDNLNRLLAQMSPEQFKQYLDTVYPGLTEQMPEMMQPFYNFLQERFAGDVSTTAYERDQAQAEQVRRGLSNAIAATTARSGYADNSGAAGTMQLVANQAAGKLRNDAAQAQDIRAEQAPYQALQALLGLFSPATGMQSQGLGALTQFSGIPAPNTAASLGQSMGIFGQWLAQQNQAREQSALWANALGLSQPTQSATS